ncbi:MAG: hypothetical protein IKX36_01445 [Prevotella sp.]|nr:hypothetical protein [Prevotella sp.]
MKQLLYIFLAVFFLISCSKGEDGTPSPIIPYNKEDIDTLYNCQSCFSSLFYDMIDERNNKIIGKANKKNDILIELHFPDDIYFSPDKKYVLMISNPDSEEERFMYMGKVQKHIYLKNYPYRKRIECPSIDILNLNDSIAYWWYPSLDDFPFRFNGNKISIYMNSQSMCPIYKQGKMSDEEQTIMNMQPDYIEELQSDTNILYKNYMDSLTRIF